MGKDLDFWKNRVEELECKLSKAQVEKQEWHDEAVAIKKNRDEMLANFRKGIEPYVDLQDMHDKIAELESQNENLKNEIAKLKQHLKSKENLYENEEIPFADEQYEEDLLAELQDRHQQDCITINQLNVTIDVLLDKMERLRNNKSMVLKCLSNFTE